MVEDKIILGIDPGTTIMGYGIIHIKNKKMSLVTFGVIHLQKLATHPDKLKRIFERVDALIKEYKPLAERAVQWFLSKQRRSGTWPGGFHPFNIIDTAFSIWGLNKFLEN